MKFVAATCPQCSGNLQVPNDRDSVKCMYCGVDVFIREAVVLGEQKINLKNYMELAKEAEKSKNYSEAYIYYMKILEIDPANYEAWQGKGTSSGWQSNLIICRFEEAKNSYRKAIELAPSDAAREVMKIEIAASALLLAKKYFYLSLDHTLKFVSVKDAQFEHANRVKDSIQLCDFAIYLNPGFTQAKAFISDIANRASSISFLDSADSKYFKRKSIQYASSLKEVSEKPKGNGALGASGWVVVTGAVAVSYLLLIYLFKVKSTIGLIFGVLIISYFMVPALLFIHLKLLVMRSRFIGKRYAMRNAMAKKQEIKDEGEL